MIDHLCSIEASLGNMDVYKLTTLMKLPWKGSKNPATKFGRDDKNEKQLAKA